ncbi:hypothetical protein [Paraclostridium sordellii]|uniref:hypothetical protein n=1 Tax=Paraclostridium sordellii TaxID=1505 RepID=UPI000AF1D896|nr:hypothetical protein [Paeniclostridium sordellii]
MLIDNQGNTKKAISIVINKFSNFTGYIESISSYEFVPSKFAFEEELLTNI